MAARAELGSAATSLHHNENNGSLEPSRPPADPAALGRAYLVDVYSQTWRFQAVGLAVLAGLRVMTLAGLFARDGLAVALPATAAITAVQLAILLGALAGTAALVRGVATRHPRARALAEAGTWCWVWAAVLGLETVTLLAANAVICRSAQAAAAAPCVSYSRALFPLPPGLHAVMCGMLAAAIIVPPPLQAGVVLWGYGVWALETGLLYAADAAGAPEYQGYDVVRVAVSMALTAAITIALGATNERIRRHAYQLSRQLAGRLADMESAANRELAAQASLALAREAEAAMVASKAVQELTLGYVGNQMSNCLHMLQYSVDCIVLTSGSSHGTRQAVADMQTALSRLRQIVQDVLSHQRLLAGRVQLNPRWHTLRAVVNDFAVRMASMHRRRLLTWVATQCPSLVHADWFRVEQILANAVANAVQASTPAGRILLEVSVMLTPAMSTDADGLQGARLLDPAGEVLHVVVEPEWLHVAATFTGDMLGWHRHRQRMLAAEARGSSSVPPSGSSQSSTEANTRHVHPAPQPRVGMGIMTMLAAATGSSTSRRGGVHDVTRSHGPAAAGPPPAAPGALTTFQGVGQEGRGSSGSHSSGENATPVNLASIVAHGVGTSTEGGASRTMPLGATVVQIGRMAPARPHGDSAGAAANGRDSSSSSSSGGSPPAGTVYGHNAASTHVPTPADPPNSNAAAAAAEMAALLPAAPAGWTWMLHLEVRNDGRGLAGKEPLGLFMPFETAGDATSTRSQAAGLGLPIAQRLARVMGGRIGLFDDPDGHPHSYSSLPGGASAEGGGEAEHSVTRFFLQLPLGHVAGITSQGPPPSAAGTGLARSHSSGHNRNVGAAAAGVQPPGCPPPPSPPAIVPPAVKYAANWLGRMTSPAAPRLHPHPTDLTGSDRISSSASRPSGGGGGGVGGGGSGSESKTGSSTGLSPVPSGGLSGWMQRTLRGSAQDGTSSSSRMGSSGARGMRGTLGEALASVASSGDSSTPSLPPSLNSQPSVQRMGSRTQSTHTPTSSGVGAAAMLAEASGASSSTHHSLDDLAALTSSSGADVSMPASGTTESASPRTHTAGRRSARVHPSSVDGAPQLASVMEHERVEDSGTSDQPSPAGRAVTTTTAVSPGTGAALNDSPLTDGGGGSGGDGATPSTAATSTTVSAMVAVGVSTSALHTRTVTAAASTTSAAGRPAPGPASIPGSTPPVASSSSESDAAPLVLVVDDVASNRRVNSAMLHRLGCKTLTAADGSEVVPALRAAQAAGGTVNLVLLDVIMRLVNGDAAFIALRKAGFTMPVVAATGNASVEDMARYRALGFDDVLPKPFTLADLRGVLQRCGVLGAPAGPAPPAPRAGAGGGGGAMGLTGSGGTVRTLVTLGRGVSGAGASGIGGGGGGSGDPH